MLKTLKSSEFNGAKEVVLSGRGLDSIINHISPGCSVGDVIEIHEEGI